MYFPTTWTVTPGRVGTKVTRAASLSSSGSRVLAGVRPVVLGAQVAGGEAQAYHLSQAENKDARDGNGPASQVQSKGWTELRTTPLGPIIYLSPLLLRHLWPQQPFEFHNHLRGCNNIFKTYTQITQSLQPAGGLDGTLRLTPDPCREAPMTVPRNLDTALVNPSYCLKSPHSGSHLGPGEGLLPG